MIGMSPLETKKLEKKQVLLVEGVDDERFFLALLRFLGIANCQVWNCGGKDYIADSIMRISKDALLPELEVLIVTRDADDNPVSAFESICNALKRYGFAAPVSKNTFVAGKPKVGVFLLADSSGNGMLEDMCLETVRDHVAMPCVQTFCNCVVNLEGGPKNRVKTEAQSLMAAHSFLAAMPEFVRHVGTAAQRGYWNFDAETLGELREFLLQLNTHT